MFSTGDLVQKMLNTFEIQELSGTLTTNGRTIRGNFQDTLQISRRFPGLPGVLDTVPRRNNCFLPYARLRTCNAAVGDFQVGLEVVVARLDVVEVVVEDADAAGAPTRAVAVQHRQHVDRAADETEVLLDAAADAHAPVAGVLHDDHLPGGTLHSQVLRLTQRVLLQRRRAAACKRTSKLVV